MQWSHINKARLIMLLALLFTALGAGVFRTSSILFMEATLCGAPLIGMAVGRLASRGLRISRQIPTCGMVGDVIRVRFTVSNAGWCPAFLVHTRSLCLDPVRTFRRGRSTLRSLSHQGAEKARLQAALVPLDAATAAVRTDRSAARPLERASDEGEQVRPIILPGAHFSGETFWQLARRGEYDVPGAGAGAFDPIGLFADFMARSAPQSLVVMPRPLKLHRLNLLAGADGTQQPRGSASVADAAEMSGVRPHRPGEGMRRIHWKATARSNVLHVVEWEEETANGVTILIDAHAPTLSGPAGADTLEASILAAASVAAYTLENGQRVAIFWWEASALGAPKLGHVEGRHRGALSHVLTGLARLVPCEHADATLPALVREVAQQGAWAEGLLMLGSDQSEWTRTWGFDFAGKARRGLAFDAASFASSAGDDTARQESAASTLPVGVRRVRCNEALSAILEHGG